MPRTIEHKQQSREKILHSAHLLFTSNGYDNTSIDEVMQHASLTRGAFYAHFDSKEELYQKAILSAGMKSRIARQKPENLNNRQWMSALVESYLSLDHVCMKTSPCALSFLVTDVAIRESSVRKTYSKVFQGLNKRMSKLLENESQEIDDKVMAATAMMIGGVAISRALNNTGARKRLLASCRQSVREMLGLEE